MKISVIVPSLDGSTPVGLPVDPRLEVVCVNGVSPVSAARNEGLARATGDWIAWVDSDDEVGSGWLDEIAKAIEENPAADVISFDAKVVWDDGSGRRPYRVGGAANAADVMSERAAGQLWNKVIRRELIEGLTFEGAAHEDYRLLCALLPRSKKVVHIDKQLYVYHRRGDGLSQHRDREAEIAALKDLVEMHENAPAEYKVEMSKGVIQRIADFSRRVGKIPELRTFVRHNIVQLLRDPKISLRVKVKCLLAM